MNHHQWLWGAGGSSPRGDMGFGVFGNDNMIPDFTNAILDKDVDITKQVDNLFSRRVSESDDWLMTLRSAAAAGVTPKNPTPSVCFRRYEAAETFLDSSSGNTSSSESSGTSLPLPNQLDFTMLREFENVQKTKENTTEISAEGQDKMFEEEDVAIPLAHGPFERAFQLERNPEQDCQFGSSSMVFYDPESQDDNDPAFRDDVGRIRPDRRSRRICRFCYKNGERPEWYTSHNLHEKNSNIVACPVLRNYECKQCGATGDFAHTDSYCPFRAVGAKDPKVTPYYEATEFKANGFQRRSKSGEATPSWHQEDFPPLRYSPL